MSKQITEPTELKTLEEGYPELQHLDSIRSLADIVRWEVVDNNLRKVSRNKFIENDITRLLRDNKTVKLFGDKGNKFYRWAAANDLTLHRRIFDDFVIMWVTEKEVKEEDASN